MQLISLQKRHGTEQLAALGGRFTVVDWTSRLDEAAGPFMDTAALMKSLDLVITSDSANAHLAGAMGVPVWVVLPFAPDWRWQLDREDSPWYPTMRRSGLANERSGAKCSNASPANSRSFSRAGAKSRPTRFDVRPFFIQ